MPARKRRNGEGTVYKDRSKDRWIGEALLRDSLGNPVRRRVSAKTEKECLKRLKETIARHESGARSLNPSMTIEEFAQQWITEILPPLARKTSTKTQYAYLCKQYVIPTWGRKKLIEVRIADVDRGLVALAKKDLSKDTVRLARAVFSLLFKEAIRGELVTVNPVHESRMPAFKASKERRAMTEEQMTTLLTATRGDRVHGPIVIGLTTGLRPGEILSLRWEDLDLESESPTLFVRESKTPAGRRTVWLSDYAVDVLHSQRALNIRTARESESMWSDDGHVFPTIVGTKWDLSNFRTAFQKACESAGIGHWTPHEMRHSAATWLFSQNLHIKAIADQLGHAHISTTADVYGHLIRQPKEIVNAFEKIRPVA